MVRLASKITFCLETFKYNSEKDITYINPKGVDLKECFDGTVAFINGDLYKNIAFTFEIFYD